MTTHKHTPAPWEACERGAYTDFDGNSRVICGDDKRIAVVQHHGAVEDEANAHLIAASPRMYEYINVRAELGDEDAIQILMEIDNAS